MPKSDIKVLMEPGRQISQNRASWGKLRLDEGVWDVHSNPGGAALDPVLMRNRLEVHNL